MQKIDITRSEFFSHNTLNVETTKFPEYQRFIILLVLLTSLTSPLMIHSFNYSPIFDKTMFFWPIAEQHNPMTSR